jgi:hypothetical protein
LLLLALVDPNQPGHYPTCPVKALTGLDCPGCGSLRALHDLAHGNVMGALGHNVLLVVWLPVVVLAGMRWATGRTLQAWLLARHTGWAAFAVVTCWAVLRNLPFPFLAPLGAS